MHYFSTWIEFAGIINHELDVVLVTKISLKIKIFVVSKKETIYHKGSTNSKRMAGSKY